MWTLCGSKKSMCYNVSTHNTLLQVTEQHCMLGALQSPAFAFAAHDPRKPYRFDKSRTLTSIIEAIGDGNAYI